jgi:hypothetical protein
MVLCAISSKVAEHWTRVWPNVDVAKQIPIQLPYDPKKQVGEKGTASLSRDVDRNGEVLDIHSEVSECMQGMLDVVVVRQLDRNVVKNHRTGCISKVEEMVAYKAYDRTDESDCGSEPSEADAYSATGWCAEASVDGRGIRNDYEDNSLGNYPGEKYKKKMKPGVGNGLVNSVTGKDVMLEVEEASGVVVTNGEVENEGIMLEVEVAPGVVTNGEVGNKRMLEVENVSVAANPAPGVVTKPAHFNAILGVHLDPRIAAGNRENMPPVSLNESRFQRHRWPLKNLKERSEIRNRLEENAEGGTILGGLSSVGGLVEESTTKDRRKLDAMSRSIVTFVAEKHNIAEEAKMSKLKFGGAASMSSKRKSKVRSKSNAMKKETPGKKKAKRKKKEKGATIRKKVRKLGDGTMRVVLEERTVDQEDTQDDSTPEVESMPDTVDQEDTQDDTPEVECLPVATVVRETEDPDKVEKQIVVEADCRVEGAICAVHLALYYELEGSSLAYYLGGWLADKHCKMCAKRVFGDTCRKVHYCRKGFQGREGQSCDGIVCAACHRNGLEEIAKESVSSGRRAASRRKRVVPAKLVSL